MPAYRRRFYHGTLKLDRLHGVFGRPGGEELRCGLLRQQQPRIPVRFDEPDAAAVAATRAGEAAPEHDATR